MPHTKNDELLHVCRTSVSGRSPQRLAGVMYCRAPNRLSVHAPHRRRRCHHRHRCHHRCHRRVKAAALVDEAASIKGRHHVIDGSSRKPQGNIALFMSSGGTQPPSNATSLPEQARSGWATAIGALRTANAAEGTDLVNPGRAREPSSVTIVELRRELAHSAAGDGEVWPAVSGSLAGGLAEWLLAPTGLRARA